MGDTVVDVKNIPGRDADIPIPVFKMRMIMFLTMDTECTECTDDMGLDESWMSLIMK